MHSKLKLGTSIKYNNMTRFRLGCDPVVTLYHVCKFRCISNLVFLQICMHVRRCTHKKILFGISHKISINFRVYMA